MTLKQKIKNNKTIFKLLDSGNAGLFNGGLVDVTKQKKGKKLSKITIEKIKKNITEDTEHLEDTVKRSLSMIEDYKKEIERLTEMIG